MKNKIIEKFGFIRPKICDYIACKQFKMQTNIGEFNLLNILECICLNLGVLRIYRKWIQK